MGDIINSRGLDDEVREKVTQAAKIAFDRINAKYRGSFLANFGLVRGDSFEGVLLTWHYAPQIMQEIIKVFYHVNKTLVRISAVMGQLTVTSLDRNEVDGPAFRDVIAALAKIKERESDHWLQVSFDIGIMGQTLISSQFGLITALTERWTDKQRVICWTAEEIEGHDAYPKETAKKQELFRLVANKLGSTPAVIRKQMNAASYEAYRQAWDGIKSYLIEIDEYVTTENKNVIQESYIPYLNIGKRRLKQRNYDDALPLLEKSLSMAIDELGENELQLISIYNCLAEVYIGVANYEKAGTMIQSALAIQTTQPKTELYIETLIEHSSLHYREEEYASAKNIAEEAISIAADILNHSHLLWEYLYNRLALALDGLSDYETALIYHEKSLNFNKNVSNAQIDYAISLHNIAELHYKASRYEKAIDCAEEAVSIFESNLPLSHEFVLYAKELLETVNANKAQEGKSK